MEELRDAETGEIREKPRLNSETGEQELCDVSPPRRPFKVPSIYLKQARSHGGYERTNGKEKLSPIIMFLLPTVFFVPVVAIFLGVAELFIHIWSHKKNKRMRRMDVQYRSPLHVIVSEFCAHCLDENRRNKISRLHEKQKNRFARASVQYFKSIVR